MLQTPAIHTNQQLRLNRGSLPIESVLSAIGGLRETRLTAVLAFLISRFPAHFKKLLLEDLDASSQVWIERNEQDDRYDILISSDLRKRPLVIEGKVGWSQNAEQLKRYILSIQKKFKRWPKVILVDKGSQDRQSTVLHRQLRIDCPSPIRFVTWDEVSHLCLRIVRNARTRRADPIGVAIAEDFAIHLRENDMVFESPKEIYLRDLWSPWSIDLYFRHYLYVSEVKFMRSLRGNLYFAPHFTRQAPEAMESLSSIPIAPGISYVSRIWNIEVVRKADLKKALIASKVPKWKGAFKHLRKKRWKELILVFLREPIQVFLTPISKSQLGIPGNAGSRSISFETMFLAARKTSSSDFA